MNNPEISVILPVFNGEPYLAKAIQSVLDQSFRDFELIILNDGSTDNSESTIRSFTDPRIVYHKNEINRGLIFTLNKGIELARGKYIARMDADDISLPQRLEKQKNYLDNHKDISILAAIIQFIDENDKDAGSWALDRKTINPVLIKKSMPRENCIAHPTIMGKSEVFKTYKFDKKQVKVEDYDLWLRLLTDNHHIDKLNDVLLKYRIHEKSVTSTANYITVPVMRVLNCKKIFLKKEINRKHFNLFNLRVAASMILDYFVFFLKSIK